MWIQQNTADKLSLFKCTELPITDMFISYTEMINVNIFQVNN